MKFRKKKKAAPTRNKMHKFKLKPSPRVVMILNAWLTILCDLYNAALQERSSAWKYFGVSLNFHDQSAELPELKQSIPALKKVNAQVAQAVLVRLQNAFEAFFRRIGLGEKAGYPRFKSYSRFDSFVCPSGSFSFNQETGKLNISKIGDIKVFLSRKIEGEIKTCTVKREADGWCVCFGAQQEIKPIAEKDKAPAGSSLGIDLGINCFAACSNGEMIPNERFHKNAEADLKRAQRDLSKKKKGSSRWRKAKHALAMKHKKVARKRRNKHYQEANKLVKNNRVIKFEDLHITGLKKGRLAKSIHDVGWSMFISIVAHKAEEAGGQVMKVNAAFTSQKCSRCGERHSMPLSQRVYRCGKCGLVIDRDYNSSIVIEASPEKAKKEKSNYLRKRKPVLTLEEKEILNPRRERTEKGMRYFANSLVGFDGTAQSFGYKSERALRRAYLNTVRGGHVPSWRRENAFVNETRTFPALMFGELVTGESPTESRFGDQ